MERTFILIKPDAVQRGLVGEIIARLEKKCLKIIGLKMLKLSQAIVQEHYAHVAKESFYEELSHFMSSSPVIAVCVEGPRAVEVVRRVAGVKNDELGSVRGDYANSGQRNLIHSSDSVASAKAEIGRFFTSKEILDYDKDEWKHVYAEADR